MENLILFSTELLFFFNEMAIYLVIGLIIAGILHVFFPDELITKHLGQNSFASVLKASLFGIPLPICSCGVIPVATSFRKKGASKGATLSFLISTPQIGTDSFLITYSLIGPIFAFFRIFAAFITAVIAGYTTNILIDKEDKIVENEHSLKISTLKNRLRNMFFFVQKELFGAIANYLLIGIIIATIITILVPENFFQEYLNNQFLSMIIMLLVSIPMYVCATSTTPIAAALMLKGLSPGAGLVLLLAGPATNAITISVITKTLGKTVTIIYLATISIVSVGLGFILNLLVVDFSKSGMMNHQHEMLPLWVKIAGSVLLSAMFVIHYMSNLLNRKKIVSAHKSDHKKMIEVFGMTCAHCSESVRKAVDGIDGTSEVNVDLKSGKVIFNFESVDMESLKKAIENKGFEVGKIT